MKKALLLLLYSLAAVTLYGQGFVVAPENRSRIYAGVPMPITIVANNCDCDHMVVTADTGSLEQTGPCQYMFISATPCEVNIRVRKKTGNKLTFIGTDKIRVRSLPAPRAVIMGQEGGDIPCAQFKVQRGLLAIWSEVQCSVVAVRQFRMLVLRDQKLIFNTQCNSALFNDTAALFMQTLQKGDKIIFTDIEAVIADGTIHHLKTIAFDLT